MYKIDDLSNIIKNESITNLSVCRCFTLKFETLRCFHYFVILETPNFYWSIDKITEGIFIQRSRNKSKIRRYFMGNRRPGYVDESCIYYGMGSILDLVGYLKNKEIKIPFQHKYKSSLSFKTRVVKRFTQNVCDKSFFGWIKLLPPLQVY